MTRRRRNGIESQALERLLLKRATEGLDFGEQAKLERLMQSASLPDAEIFERVAAAIHVGRIAGSARLPEALRQRLEQQGIDYLSSKNGASRDG